MIEELDNGGTVKDNKLTLISAMLATLFFSLTVASVPWIFLTILFGFLTWMFCSFIMYNMERS